MDITNTNAWKNLLQHRERFVNTDLNDLFKKNPKRFQQFSKENCDVLYDFSKQQLDFEVLQDLIELAHACDLNKQIQALFAGVHVNKTEDRPALHHQLRRNDSLQEIKETRKKVKKFASGFYKRQIKHIISLGIGGSDLGPMMVCEALNKDKNVDLNIHFISNVDGTNLEQLLMTIDPGKTICLINSKTFTTVETLLNANTVKNWFSQQLGEDAIVDKMFAVTANAKKAIEFGISEENIFLFWDWVGGRYSVWSAVGLPIELLLGTEQFEEFLAGARAMDQHFFNTDFANNLPVLMALIGIWNINFLDYKTLLVMPYLDGLRNFPAYLQQLEMESNGKRAINGGGYAAYNTAPIIWGGVGCNGQHSYMQLLHQGTHTVPIDFIAAINGSKLTKQQDLLLASCFSQSKALMQGLSEKDLLYANTEELAQAKMCPGNKPSSTILFSQLTPKILGGLIALYEHKVFVQGVIWQVQSFDQWGVELGKKLTSNILSKLHDGELEQFDSSTAGLLEYIRRK